MKRLATWMQRENVLINLDLSDNFIGPTGAKFFASVLSDNVNLMELNLGMNKLGNEGAIELFKNVSLNESIVKLDISCNGNILFFDTQTIYLLFFFWHTVDPNCSACVLHMCICLGITYKSSNAIIEMIEANSCIKELDLSGNQIEFSKSVTFFCQTTYPCLLKK